MMDNYRQEIKAYNKIPKINNSFFGRYYMPFIPNDFLLIIPYLVLLIIAAIGILKADNIKLLYKIFILLSYILIVVFILWQRLFRKVHTGLYLDKNVITIRRILNNKGYKYHYNNNGCFIVINNPDIKLLGTEYIFIICKDNYIHINNYYSNSLFWINKKNVNIIINNVNSYR